jgi:hypothetical protein
MSTLTIDATTPSASVNLAVLRSTLGRILEKARRHEISLGKDEYQLLYELCNATTTGSGSGGTISQIVITYT